MLRWLAAMGVTMALAFSAVLVLIDAMMIVPLSVIFCVVVALDVPRRFERWMDG